MCVCSVSRRDIKKNESGRKRKKKRERGESGWKSMEEIQRGIVCACTIEKIDKESMCL
jgi:hypothetical protein